MKALMSRFYIALFGSIVSAQLALAKTDGPNPDLLNGANDAHAPGTPGTLFGSGGVFHVIANTLIYLVGAISVLVIIFGGLRYVTSTGDSTRVKEAKDTILYGVIGVVIAIIAFAIVDFVIKSIK